MAKNKSIQQKTSEAHAGFSWPMIIGASVSAFTLLAIGTGIAAYYIGRNSAPSEAQQQSILSPVQSVEDTKPVLNNDNRNQDKQEKAIPPQGAMTDTEVTKAENGLMKKVTESLKENSKFRREMASEKSKALADFAALRQSGKVADDELQKKFSELKNAYQTKIAEWNERMKLEMSSIKSEYEELAEKCSNAAKKNDVSRVSATNLNMLANALSKPFPVVEEPAQKSAATLSKKMDNQTKAKPDSSNRKQDLAQTKESKADNKQPAGKTTVEKKSDTDRSDIPFMPDLKPPTDSKSAKTAAQAKAWQERKEAFEVIRDATQRCMGDRFVQLTNAATNAGAWHIDCSCDFHSGTIRDEKNMTPYELASVVKAVGMDSASLYFSSDKDGDATYSIIKPLKLYISTSKTTTLSKEAKLAVGRKLPQLPVIAKQIYATEQCLVMIHQGNLEFKKQFTDAEQTAIVDTLRFFGNEVIFSDCPYKARASEALASISANVKRK